MVEGSSPRGGGMKLSRAGRGMEIYKVWGESRPTSKQAPSSGRLGQEAESEALSSRQIF